MWLLNTSSFKLEEFHSDVPSYAILSHRWKNGEELSFGGLEEPHPYADRTGYKKVKTFCVEARKKRLEYVWVDTCCIDKKSSAELSEAINSMYTFYSRATTCYVYLHDVVALEDFEQSSWFTRGWTLQELLAPSKMHFFNHKWEPIGSKGKLAPRIERITGIPGKALRNFNPNGYCIADKLSWSAKRQTTREEDCAYCLLGVFQINMPLLYGEDMSIFLWQGPAVNAFGMLASNPSCFADTPDNIRSMTRSCTNLFSMSEGWTLNNAGITIKASICPYLITSDFECIFAMHLHEPYTFSGNPGLAIFVKKEQEQGSRAFARVTIDGVAWTSSATEPDRCMWSRHRVVKLRLLRQPIQDIRTPTRPCGFTVTFTLDALDLCAAYQRPAGNFEASLRSWQRIRKTSSGSLKCWFSANSKYATGVHGYLLITLMYDIQVLICLGLSDNFQPMCVVLPLCKRELDEGLGCARILREYRTISKNRSDSFEIFDTEIQMICMCGEDNALENFTDIGLSLGVSDQSSHTGKLEAMIQFDVGKFIQYYVPTADLSSYEDIGYIPREDFGKLSDVELQIGSTRRSRYLFR